MPKVQKLYEKYNDKNFTVIGMLTDTNFQKALQLTKKSGCTYVNLAATEGVKRKYNVKAVPQYVIIDENGEVIYARSGFSSEIETLLKEKIEQ